MSNPTLGVWPLQDDLDGQGPSGALSLTGAGPIRYDGGLWLEEAGTNLLSNPAAVTGTTSWALGSGGGTVFLERVTSLPAPLPDPLTSLVTTGFRIYATGNNTSFPIAAINVTINDADHSAGVWMYVPTSFTGAAPRIRRGNFTSATGDEQQFADLGLRDQWQLLEITFNPDAGDLSGQMWINMGATVNTGDEIWFTAYQLEEKAYLTSFILDSFGDGYSNSPSPHSRAASSASIDPAGILSPGAGAIAMRVTPTIETGVEEIWGECGVKGAGTDHVRWGRDSTKHPFVEWSANDAAYTRLTATETIDAGTQAFIYLGHDGTDITLQVNAGSLQADTRNAVEDDFSTGDLTLQASAGGVIYDDFATFDRALTAKEIAQVRRAGNFSLGMFDGNPYIHFQLRPY